MSERCPTCGSPVESIFDHVDRVGPDCAEPPSGINPTESDIGRKVVYRTAPNYEPEEGVITSFNERCVFVRYGSQQTSQATSREDLDWVTP